MDNAQPLLLDTASRWFRQRLREFRVPFITSLVVGFLSYTPGVLPCILFRLHWLSFWSQMSTLPTKPT